MNFNNKIYVAGHKGLVGSACLRILKAKGYKNIICKNSSELDLRNQKDVHEFLKVNKPDVVIDAAAKVGGILANDKYPYEFLVDNLLIQTNLISSSFQLNISKFIFLGSSCIYPKLAPQPLKEEFLLTDSLEPTNQWYAIAKISGVKLIEALKLQYKKDYVSLMPTNLYGPFDNFDLESSHVLPAMIRKFHDAKINNKACVDLWGSGKPFREFLYVDDLAEAILFCLENSLPDNLYNVGNGVDVSIKELAVTIKKIVGYEGEINWDRSKPDGTPRKLMDSSKINDLGWNAKYNLELGISKTYKWFKENQDNYRKLQINK
tara:strand:+ start:17582 stop:18538 length:957 start_codon:yes stop_codon:yes gene_type:complete